MDGTVSVGRLAEEQGTVVGAVLARAFQDDPLAVFMCPDAATRAREFAAHFAAVVRGDITLHKYDLAGLENNVMVVRILAAARESAAIGKPVDL